MKLSEFEQHYNHIQTQVEDILITKAKEYATDQDRLANFKQTTSLLNANQAQVCLYYDSKHIASLAKICEDINQGIFPSQETLEEKTKDYLAYGYLLYANIMELKDTNNPPAKIGSISHVEAPRSDFRPKDDITTVSQEKQQIEKTPTKIDWVARILGESIASPLTDLDKLNLTTNL